MNVNFFGALYCTQAALPSLMERDGLIIVISSVAGFAPLLGRSGYAASKHALHGLFETLRTELQKTGVDVMMVCPNPGCRVLCVIDTKTREKHVGIRLHRVYEKDTCWKCGQNLPTIYVEKLDKEPK